MMIHKLISGFHFTTKRYSVNIRRYSYTSINNSETFSLANVLYKQLDQVRLIPMVGIYYIDIHFYNSGEIPHKYSYSSVSFH